MNFVHTVTHKISVAGAIVLAALALTAVATQPAAAATSRSTATYTWSGSCVYRWSNGSWVKQGCLMRMGGKLYFHDAISPAWYLHIRSGTWWVKLYPHGWMTGEQYRAAWGFYNALAPSLYRQMCIKLSDDLCLGLP